MAEEPENLTLRMLRSVDSKQATLMERFQDLPGRIGSIEDQLVERLLRIERRLDLIGA
jgi:hypothetical protein